MCGRFLSLSHTVHPVRNNDRMQKVLVVHHTVSPPLQELLELVLAGLTGAARVLDIKDLNVTTRAALTASAIDVLEADAIVLGTPANLGYMSGALKHFFDQIYYPCLSETIGMPFGFYVHGNNDTVGAVRGIERIVTGLRWRAVRPPVTVIGPITRETKAEIEDLTGLLLAQ